MASIPWSSYQSIGYEDLQFYKEEILIVIYSIHYTEYGRMVLRALIECFSSQCVRCDLK